MAQTKQQVMSKSKQLERQKEIIGLLEKTIKEELGKPSGGNSDIVTALTIKLNKVRDWKYKENE